VLESAEGIFLPDVDGRRYMDFHGNNVLQIGYGNHRVIARIAEAMQSIPFSPRRYTNLFAVALARELSTLIPGRKVELDGVVAEKDVAISIEIAGAVQPTGEGVRQEAGLRGKRSLRGQGQTRRGVGIPPARPHPREGRRRQGHGH
jgi:hypothetical protein